MKVEVDQLDINQLLKAATGLHDFWKKKGNKLDAGKLETVPKDFKTLEDVVDKEVVKTYSVYDSK